MTLMPEGAYFGKSLPNSKSVRVRRNNSRATLSAISVASYCGVGSLAISKFSSPAAGLLLFSVVLAVHSLIGQRVPVLSKMHLVTVLFYVLYLALGLALGGYRLGAGSLMSELRWLPAVVYSIAISLSAGRNRQTYVVSTRNAIVSASALCLIAGLLVPDGLREPWELWGLTSSHHIPGLISGGGLILLWQVPYRSGRAQYAALAILLPVLLLSQSRTAILAIALVGGAQAVKSAYRRLDLRQLAACLALFILVLAVSSRTRDTVIWLATPGEFSNITSSGNGHGSSAGLSSSQANVSNRFALYRQSLEALDEYWLAGIGPGHLNDYFENSEGLAAGPFPPPGNQFHRVETETTAHNFWLHVSAESGLLGVGVLSILTWMFLVGRSSSHISRYLLLLGLTSGGLLTIAIVMPWLSLALLMQGSNHEFKGHLVKEPLK